MSLMKRVPFFFQLSFMHQPSPTSNQSALTRLANHVLPLSARNSLQHLSFLTCRLCNQQDANIPKYDQRPVITLVLQKVPLAARNSLQTFVCLDMQVVQPTKCHCAHHYGKNTQLSHYVLQPCALVFVEPGEKEFDHLQGCSFLFTKRIFKTAFK